MEDLGGSNLGAECASMAWYGKVGSRGRGYDLMTTTRNNITAGLQWPMMHLEHIEA